MRPYSTKISLLKNSRGLYSLDTVLGCSSGTTKDKFGCFSDCYAAKAAYRYGYDFSNHVLRDFNNERHLASTIKKINSLEADFIRIGTSGDPSEDWIHTFNILNKIKETNKKKVIITKHWKNIPDSLLLELSRLGVVINTSISALDEKHVLENAITQYERLKPFCKSVLRIVTCDFNDMHPLGFELAILQDKLIKIDDNYIDTVFRPSKDSKYIKNNVINVNKKRFLNSKVLVSKLNKKAYFGHCDNCKEKCGI